MHERSIDRKMFQSCPDDFDIIKVDLFTAGARLQKGMIVKVVAVDSGSSGLPAGVAANMIVLISKDTVLRGSDSATLLGYRRDYSAIQFVTQPTFANDTTSVVVAGVGKNMSVFNNVTQSLVIHGWFNQIQIPESSTDTIIIAYR